jgi:hypothetical protein
MTTYEYVTSPTGTVHLIRQTESIHSTWFGYIRTLCGRNIEQEGWDYGDETQSGIAATCQRCRYIVRPRGQKRSRT